MWTKILVPPQGFEDYIPYFSGIVQFEDKTKLPVQITDCKEKDLKEGMKVITVIRRGAKVRPAEVIEYVIKVRPTP